MLFREYLLWHCRKLFAVLAFGLCVPTVAAEAREVLLPHGKLALHGVLDLAPGKTLADGAVLMLHGNMAHADMGVMRQFRRSLNAAGFNTLAINLSLGHDRRRGMLECHVPITHRVEDALPELAAWLDWLGRQGVREATLLGFSRGAHQVAWFLAEQTHPLARSAVLLAPIVGRDGAVPERYQARYGRPLAPVLEEAHTLVAAGQADKSLDKVGFLACDAARVSAAAFLSHYDLAVKNDTPALLARIRVPTLVVVAGGDEIARDTAPRLRPGIDGKTRHLTVVPGADHFFRDLYGEDAAEAILSFLRERRGH